MNSAKVKLSTYFWAMFGPVKLHLKAGREDSILRGHPWVFSGSLAAHVDAFPEGAWAVVCDAQGRPLASGYLCHGSIAVRLLVFGPTSSDPETAIEEQVKKALQLRLSLGFRLSAESAVRLVNGEGDGLPGVIADWYGGFLVVQLHVRALRAYQELLQKIFFRVLGEGLKKILFRDTWNYPSAETDFSNEKPTFLEIRENGLRFTVKPGSGQKTGFYLDQRNNRLLCRQLAAGRRVLNLFSFTGGFTLNALAGGAQEAVSVDSSGEALSILQNHLKINNLEKKTHRAYCADIFKWIANFPETFDVVICDPPSLARSAQARHTAIQAYKRLNEQVLQKVEPGGLLFTFSCTAVVSVEHFEGALRAAAISAGRRVYILKQLDPDLDHPWAMAHPEGRYLKGFLLHVE
ncbi:MAG: class I SAM-dependent rRNA methyltransferase [Flavobacteriales bacterium]|nr:class I SAM-dependent rRNA methyltransferase [Flavobacteriales bacterium]MDW8432176.1 class I SAM-dependent rRNA methyltransferase [Flavobacteriales bacterium]